MNYNRLVFCSIAWYNKKNGKKIYSKHNHGDFAVEVVDEEIVGEDLLWLVEDVEEELLGLSFDEEPEEAEVGVCRLLGGDGGCFRGDVDEDRPELCLGDERLGELLAGELAGLGRLDEVLVALGADGGEGEEEVDEGALSSVERDGSAGVERRRVVDAGV